MAVPKRTVRLIIQKALQKLGVYASGETVLSDDMNDGLVSFQDMLAEWAADKMLVPALVTDSFPLVTDQVVYTIGEDGADIDTVRPDDIKSAFVRETTTDYPVRIITKQDYDSFSDKFNGGSRPEYLWYNPTAPNGTISIYRAPAGNYTMFVTSLKAFTSATKLTNDIFLELGIPEVFNNPLVYNLAVELAPEYGIGAGELSIVAARAESGKSRMRSLAAANRAQPAQVEFAAQRYGNEDLIRYRN